MKNLMLPPLHSTPPLHPQKELILLHQLSDNQRKLITGLQATDLQTPVVISMLKWASHFDLPIKEMLKSHSRAAHDWIGHGFVFPGIGIPPTLDFEPFAFIAELPLFLKAFSNTFPNRTINKEILLKNALEIWAPDPDILGESWINLPADHKLTDEQNLRLLNYATREWDKLLALNPQAENLLNLSQWERKDSLIIIDAITSQDTTYKKFDDARQSLINEMLIPFLDGVTILPEKLSPQKGLEELESFVFKGDFPKNPEYRKWRKNDVLFTKNA